MAVVTVYALSTVSTIVFPLVFAAVAAVLALPLVDVLGRRGLPRPLGALLGLVLVIGLVVGVLALITWSIYDQRTQILSAFKTVVQQVTDLLDEQGFDTESLDSVVDRLQSWLATGAGGVLSNAVSVASGAFVAILGIFFSLVFLFFLLRDGPSMAVWVKDRLEPSARGHVDNAGQSAIHALRMYFAGRSIVAAVDAVLIGLTAWVLDVPLVSAIVVLTFVGGFIPYIGAVTAGAVAVVLALATHGLGVALIMLAAILVVQNIIEPLVEARAIGGTLGLHPMVVIIVTTIGGLTIGLTGLVLAAPLTSAVLSFTRQVADGRVAGSTPGADPGEASRTG